MLTTPTLHRQLRGVWGRGGRGGIQRCLILRKSAGNGVPRGGGVRDASPGPGRGPGWAGPGALPPRAGLSRRSAGQRRGRRWRPLAARCRRRCSHRGSRPAGRRRAPPPPPPPHPSAPGPGRPPGTGRHSTAPRGPLALCWARRAGGWGAPRVAGAARLSAAPAGAPLGWRRWGGEGGYRVRDLLV